MLYSSMNLMLSNNLISLMSVMFHYYCLLIISFILLVVLIFVFLNYNTKFYLQNFLNQYAEFLWTVLPMTILLSLGIPSFLTMYMMEKDFNKDLTVKAISHQWYWSYENNLFSFLNTDSYMDNNVQFSHNRLLEVDNQLKLPYNSSINFIITSSDVLHAWTLPSFAYKMDAVPGRLNSLNLMSNSPSIFYSQCSELCSINHSFMPICVEFINWSNMMD